MSRRALLLAALIGAVSLPAPARAQVTLYFNAPGDTASAGMPGSELRIQVRAKNPYYYGNYYSGWATLNYARATFAYDPAKIQLIGVDATGGSLFDIISVTPGAGTLAVAASGYALGTDQLLYELRAKLQPGVTDGTYLWIRGDSVQVTGYNNGSMSPPALGAVGQVCHASEMWGDVDGNAVVDSRDALITLSAAVGLPNTGGFDLSRGDVDGDGLTNSRDALLMLSYAIGLGGGGTRVGAGIVDACPGLTAPGETVVFSRTASGGGGIYRLDAASTTPVQLTTLATDLWPRLNAGASLMAFECLDGNGYTQICRSDQTGANRTMVTGPGAPGNTMPDWSPNGATIVFLRGTVGVNTQIYVMDSTGANQVPAFSSGMFASAVGWSRDNTTFALSNPSRYGIYTTQLGVAYVNPLDLNFSYVTYLRPIRWSPDGTASAAVNATNNRGGILTLPATGGTSAPALAPSGIRAFDWGPQGVIFSFTDWSGNPSLWLLQGGFGGPLARLTSGVAGQVDDQPSFRRNP